MYSTPVSVLPLQILIYFDNLYSCIYFLIELSLFIYKGYTLTYPPNSVGPEIVCMFFFIALQYLRLFIGNLYPGSVGNKTEAVPGMGWFLGLSVPTVLACIYYLQLQTYVYAIGRLMADLIVNVLLLVFMILEILLAVIAIIKFKSAEKNR